MNGKLLWTHGLVAMRSLTGRLYLSAAIVMAAFLGMRALAGAAYADLLHQSIGAMMIAGVIWFADILIAALVANSNAAAPSAHVKDFSALS